MTVRITEDRVADVLKAIRVLTSKEVLVGVPEENATRDPVPGEEGEPVSNAALGYIHEFGAPEANIPARPFLFPAIEGMKDEIVSRLRRAGETALAGDLTKLDAQFTALGLRAVSAVQRKMVEGPFAPLSPVTIAARERRGVTRTNPLIDTGALRQAISHVVVKKK